MARKSKIENLNKIRPNNKTVRQVRNERDAGQARLINFKSAKPVEMQWGMNDSTVQDQVFILKIGKEEAWLSAEDMQRFLRWV